MPGVGYRSVVNCGGLVVAGEQRTEERITLSSPKWRREGGINALCLLCVCTVSALCLLLEI